MGDIDWRHLLFQFDGRLNRAKYWLGIVVVAVVATIASLIAAGVDSSVVWVIFGIFAIFLIWPSVAVEVKRWHDRDKSGWWWLIRLIPLVGPFWVLIECGFLEGTDGPNRFGADPLRNERIGKMGA
jgi:uncharacterized membrane protein YhaH (DUF805 family)